MVCSWPDSRAVGRSQLFLLPGPTTLLVRSRCRGMAFPDSPLALTVFVLALLRTWASPLSHPFDTLFFSSPYQLCGYKHRFGSWHKFKSTLPRLLEPSWLHPCVGLFWGWTEIITVPDKKCAPWNLSVWLGGVRAYGECFRPFNNGSF